MHRRRRSCPTPPRRSARGTVDGRGRDVILADCPASTHVVHDRRHLAARQQRVARQRGVVYVIFKDWERARRRRGPARPIYTQSAGAARRDPGGAVSPWSRRRRSRGSASPAASRCRSSDRRQLRLRASSSRRRPDAHRRRRAAADRAAPVLTHLPRRRAAAALDVDRVRPRPWASPSATSSHPADLSRLGLCQRLQQVRPHLPGPRAGRRAVPPQPEDIAGSTSATPGGDMVPLGTARRRRRPSLGPR